MASTENGWKENLRKEKIKIFKYKNYEWDYSQYI